MTSERYSYGPLTDDELQHVAAAVGHHALSIDRMAPLPVNRGKYKIQGSYQALGQKLPPEVVNGLASSIDSRYDEMKASLDDATIEVIGGYLRRGYNVAFALPHSQQFTDIGLGYAAPIEKLTNAGYDFEAATVLGIPTHFEGIHFGDEKPTPDNSVAAAEAFGYLCDQVFTSVPKSPRFQALIASGQLSERRVNKHNKKMLEASGKWLSKGGRLLAVAPTGTSDVVENGVHKQSTLTSGTIALLKTPKLLVQPLVVRLDKNAPIVSKFVGQPRQIESDLGAHAVMFEITNELNSQTDQKFVYELPS